MRRARSASSKEETPETLKSDLSQSDLDTISNIFEAAERMDRMDQALANLQI